MRYNAFAGEQIVTLLSCGASAWKLGGRDRFIGWQEPQRLTNLQRVRAKLKLSQSQFADLLGMSARTVQESEYGRNPPGAPAAALLRGTAGAGG